MRKGEKRERMTKKKGKWENKKEKMMLMGKIYQKKESEG